MLAGIGRGALVLSAEELSELDSSGQLDGLLDGERRRLAGREHYYQGRRHLRGESGLPRDPHAALQFFQCSANNGDVKGMCALAMLLASGEAGARDVKGAKHLYEAAAEQGCASAHVAIGEIKLREYRRLKRAQPDAAAAAHAEAIKHFESSAAASHPQSGLWLARANEMGTHRRAPGGENSHAQGTLGRQQNMRDQAMQAVAHASQAGTPEGGFFKANAICGGKLPPAAGSLLTEEASLLLEHSASQGYAPAMYVLGCESASHTSNGISTVAGEKAQRWWRQAAALGHYPSAALLAQAMLGGTDGVSCPSGFSTHHLVSAETEQEAKRLLEAAAGAGEAEGFVGLGLYYSEARWGRTGNGAAISGGTKAPRDLRLSLAFYNVGARLGALSGQVGVEALLLERTDREVLQRDAKPLERYLRATLVEEARGSGEGLLALGRRCYRQGVERGEAGEGVLLRWAVLIFERCVKRGEVAAFLALARLYIEGSGVASPCPSQAASLHERGAQLGHAPAAFGLCQLYWEHLSDLEHALQWLRVAERLGTPPERTRELFDQLIECLPRDAVARADRRAARWLERHLGMPPTEPFGMPQTRKLRMPPTGAVDESHRLDDPEEHDYYYAYMYEDQLDERLRSSLKRLPAKQTAPVITLSRAGSSHHDADHEYYYDYVHAEKPSKAGASQGNGELYYYGYVYADGRVGKPTDAEYEYAYEYQEVPESECTDVANANRAAGASKALAASAASAAGAADRHDAEYEFAYDYAYEDERTGEMIPSVPKASYGSSALTRATPGAQKEDVDLDYASEAQYEDVGRAGTGGKSADVENSDRLDEAPLTLDKAAASLGLSRAGRVEKLAPASLAAAASLAASLSQFAVGEGKFEYYEDFGSEILDAEPPALPHQDSVEYEYSYYEMSESLLCE